MMLSRFGGEFRACISNLCLMQFDELLAQLHSLPPPLIPIPQSLAVYE